MPAEVLRVLFIGDVFGHPGRDILLRNLPAYRQAHQIDFCIADAENAAHGNGITPPIADALLKSGVDLVTAGDHVWDRMELEEYLYTCPRIIRPLNFPEDSPGRGVAVVETADYTKVCVIGLVGRVFMKPADNPFVAVEKALERHGTAYPVTIVEIHAEATSEKIAMARFLDGKVSAVIGTHTHIPTADERILPGGTAYITDVGMTGPCDSIIGLESRDVIRNYRFHTKRKFVPATGDLRMQGVIVEIGTRDGKARRITRVDESYDRPV
ncbi:MAG: TIGR00282 family metallophosphoesterase [Planctomycetota bacterium]